MGAPLGSSSDEFSFTHFDDGQAVIGERQRQRQRQNELFLCFMSLGLTYLSHETKDALIAVN
jgi:hypothetical protein